MGTERLDDAMKSFAVVTTLFALAAPYQANAQSYPTKPIRVITANSAGGTSDIFVRALGDELQKRLASRSSWRTAPAAA